MSPNKAYGQTSAKLLRREPQNPRQSMEPSDMEPDDARRFIRDLLKGIHDRMRELDEDNFNTKELQTPIHNGERAKQWYANDKYQLLSGIQAALREWGESGRETEELRERYGGKFVEGVEVGERLAVYQGSDFTFTEVDDSSADDSKFTFTG